MLLTLMLLTLLACSVEGAHHGQADASDCAALPTLRQPFYLGLETTLGADKLHVLTIAGSDAAVDGVPAKLTRARARTHVNLTDSVGRSVQLNLCLKPDGSGKGKVERCAAARCENGEVRAQPLAWHMAPEAPEATPRQADSEYNLIGEYHGADWPEAATLDLHVADNVAVLTRGTDGLRIVKFGAGGDLSINELSHVRPEGGDFWNDVVLHHDFALVASHHHGLVVVDLREPADPQLVYKASLLGSRANGHNLFIDGNVAYLARTAPRGGIAAFNVMDPSLPELLYDLELPGCEGVHDLYVKQPLAFVNCSDFGLLVMDMSSPEAPAVVSRYPQPLSHSSWVTDIGGSQQLLLFSAEGFATRIEIAKFDVSSGLTHLGSFGLDSAASMHNLQCFAERCFVSAYQEGWFELDVSQPDAPVAQRGGATWSGPAVRFFEGASGIAVVDDRVFIADTERGLMIYER